MNSADFIDEVKNSGICPENFEEVYSEFQGFQKDALDTLKEVHRVCEKNSILYELAFGSLLGFVRDGGQIPWDYDIDIIVPYEQKNKLIEALKKDLDGKFYFYCPETNKKCRHMIMRVAPVGYRTEALHVDVFFCVGTPEEEKKRINFAKRIKEISDIRFGKLVNIREEALGDARMALRLWRQKIPAIFANLRGNIKSIAQSMRHWILNTVFLQIPLPPINICPQRFCGKRKLNSVIMAK